MVTRDDLYNEAEYQDIREDVRLECLQYGKVSYVSVVYCTVCTYIYNVPRCW